jgi:hypothetical protein
MKILHSAVYLWHSLQDVHRVRWSCVPTQIYSINVSSSNSANPSFVPKQDNWFDWNIVIGLSISRGVQLESFPQSLHTNILIQPENKRYLLHLTSFPVHIRNESPICRIFLRSSERALTKQTNIKMRVLQNTSSMIIAWSARSFFMYFSGFLNTGS